MQIMRYNCGLGRGRWGGESFLWPAAGGQAHARSPASARAPLRGGAYDGTKKNGGAVTDGPCTVLPLKPLLLVLLHTKDQQPQRLHVVLLAAALLHVAVGLELGDVVGAAQKQRQALVQPRRRDAQDAPPPVARAPARGLAKQR